MNKKYARGRVCFKCQYCGTPRTEYTSKFATRRRYNCSSSECIAKAKAHKGSENPMYGKTHTDDVKKASQQRAKTFFSGKSYEELYGIDGAKRLKEIRSATFSSFYANNPQFKGVVWKGRTHEQRSLNKIKTSMILGGHWRSPDQIDDWDFYNREANWKHSMWELLPEECQNLIKKVGIFSRGNTQGAVRDHKYSRWSGFNDRVFPEVLRHPANCKALSQSDNAKKRSSNSITLEELFYHIRQYNDEWEEHLLVLSLIEQYENGARWTRRLEV